MTDDEKSLFDFSTLLDSGDLVHLTVPTTGAFPLFITQALKMRLRQLGYSDAAIFEMAPADAHTILGLIS